MQLLLMYAYMALLKMFTFSLLKLLVAMLCSYYIIIYLLSFGCVCMVCMCMCVSNNHLCELLSSTHVMYLCWAKCYNLLVTLIGVQMPTYIIDVVIFADFHGDYDRHNQLLYPLCMHEE